MRDLKERTIRGGVAKLCAQAVNFVLRLGSLMIIARLLEPQDFGLVGMVTAFTGVLSLFKDFGLSSAAVQRESGLIPVVFVTVSDPIGSGFVTSLVGMLRR